MRRISARRAFQDALISGASVLVLLMILVAVDDRVRSEVWRRSSVPSVELAGAGYQAQHFVHVIAGAVKDQSQTHAPLMTFAVAATILTLFMLRT